MTTIGIISDSSYFLNKLEKNLSLMRGNDIFLRYDFSDFNNVRPDTEIVLIYSEHSNVTENFINKIKNEKNYIILFLPPNKENLILKLYDYGINDFCYPDASISELIIKIVNGQKYLSEKNLNGIYRNILSANAILKENNSIYRNLKTVLTRGLFKKYARSSFLAIDIPEEWHEKFISLNLETKMVNALRACDIIVNYKDFSYFLILSDTDLDKAKNVFDKVSNILDIDLIGMLLRYKPTNEDLILEKIENLRVTAQKEGKTFVTEPEDNSTEKESDWLDSNVDFEEEGHYKFFKVMYETKVEKVIKPVFFRMREKYEDILSDIRINHIYDKNSCEFLIFKGDVINSLKILFTNSPNLTFKSNFSGIYAPENVEYTVPFKQLSVKNLTEILEKFIKEGVKNETVK